MESSSLIEITAHSLTSPEPILSGTTLRCANAGIFWKREPLARPLY